MKRSEVLLEIIYILDTENELSPTDRSELILTKLEQLGMLRPYVPSRQDILDEDDWGRIDSINYRWEEE